MPTMPLTERREYETRTEAMIPGEENVVQYSWSVDEAADRTPMMIIYSFALGVSGLTIVCYTSVVAVVERENPGRSLL